MKVYKAVHGNENKCKELHKEMKSECGADSVGSTGFLFTG